MSKMANLSFSRILYFCISFCLFDTFLECTATCRGDSCPACPTNPNCVCTESTLANCSGLGYFSFPETGDLGKFNELDFSNNNFTELKTMALPNNALTKIVDLSKNAINKLNGGSFTGASSLETIILADNKLQVLPDNAFTQLDKLNQLDLSGNLFKTLMETSFSPNMAVTELILRDNNFTKLDYKIMQSTFSKVIKLDLDGNKLNCDSQMKWVASWKENKTIKGICDSPPQLKGRSLDSILEQQFDDPSYQVVTDKPTPDAVDTTNKMETTTAKKSDKSDDSGPNAAVIVIPLILILILVIVLAIVFWKKYWQPSHSTDKKYSAVNREQNASNRVYSDTTTDL